MVCEECWAKAQLIAMGDSSRTVTDCYMELVCKCKDEDEEE